MNTYHRMRSMAPFGLLLALLLTAVPVQAQSEPENQPHSATPTCVTLADGNPYYLVAADWLAHAIPEQPGKAPGAGVFHRDAVFTRPHQPGQRILLSGSETGSGFVTDDILTLETIPLYQERSWDFRSADRMRIIPRRSPADITDLFLPEQFNMVTVTMQDVLGPVFRSSDLWLLTYSPCDWLIATPTATHTPMPTHTAVPTVCTETPTMTPTATSTPTIISTNVPTAVRTPERAIGKAGSTPTAESVPSLPTATPLPPQASADADAPTMMTHQHIRIALLALLLSGSLLALYGWLVMRAYVPLPRWRNWRKQVGHYLRTMRMRWRMVRSFIDKQMKP